MNLAQAHNYFQARLTTQAALPNHLQQRNALVKLFDEILAANQNLAGIREINALHINGIVNRLNMEFPNGFIANAQMTTNDRMILFLKNALVQQVGPVDTQLSRNAIGLQIQYEWDGDKRAYPLNNPQGEPVARDLDRLARIFYFNGTVCSSVSIVNSQFCIGVNKFPNRVNAVAFKDMVNDRREQILELA